MLDMVQKYRDLGEPLPGAKLTVKEVRRIRQLLDKEMSQDAIAALIGVSQGAVSHIKLGKTWSWLD
jgi:DNA-binding transcriptional regulator YiaG